MFLRDKQLPPSLPAAQPASRAPHPHTPRTVTWMVPPRSVCVSLPVSATTEGQDGSLVPLLTTDSQGFWNLPCEPLRLPGAAAQPWAHSSPLPDILPSAPSAGCSLCPGGGWGCPSLAAFTLASLLQPARASQLPPATPSAPRPQCPPPVTENTSPWGRNPCAKAPRPRAQDSDGSSKAETASAASATPPGGGGLGVVLETFSSHACNTDLQRLPRLAAAALSERRGACRLRGTGCSPGLFPPARWCRLAQRGQDALGRRLGGQGGSSHPHSREA